MRPKKLWKTTIVIFSTDDPREKYEIVELAHEATNGMMYSPPTLTGMALSAFPKSEEVELAEFFDEEDEDPTECPHCGSSLIYCSDPDGSDEWGCHDCKKTFTHPVPCDHEPDTHTIRPADGAEGVCDILCKKCGCSGSFRFEAHTAEIMWEG
jgi:hypothetical protein